MDPSQDPSSPYYVHPGENSSAVHVSPPLNGNNYHSWALFMKRAIILKSKFGFLDGSIPTPERFDPSFNAWKRCNKLARSWLINSVSPSIAQSLIYTESAAEIWKDLKERYSGRKLIRVCELLQQLNSTKQNSNSVTEYFTKLKVIWGELDYIRPIPECSCDAAGRVMKAYKNEDDVFRFLDGLNEEFSVVRIHILLMDTLPPLHRVFSMALQHERLNNLCDKRKEIDKGNVNSSAKAKQCTFCGRVGHRVETCYRKNGFPSR